MGLPRLSEFILSIRRPTGGFVAEQGGTQWIVTNYMPGIRLSSTTSPPAAKYAIIVHKFWFGTSMLPDAFDATLQQVGHTLLSVTVSQVMIDNVIEGFWIVTHDNPVLSSCINNSNQLQYIEEIWEYIIIASVQDYELVMRSLDSLANNEGSALAQRMRAMQEKM